MSKINLLEVTDLNDEKLAEIIDSLGDEDVEHVMIVGFASDEKTSECMHEFAEKIKAALLDRQNKINSENAPFSDDYFA